MHTSLSWRLGVDKGGTRRSRRLHGRVPSNSENTISDCRTRVIEELKSAANEANPKRGRPSKKGASNKYVAADSVNESAVIGQIAKEVVVGSSRPEIGEWAKESVHVEEVVPQNQIEVHTTMHVEIEMHVNEDVMQTRKDGSFISPSKFVKIGKKRRANHGSSLFNYMTCFYLLRPVSGRGREAERSRILGVFHSAKLGYLCLSLQCGTSCHPLECLPFWGCFAARVTLASGLLLALHSLDACEGLTRAISTG
ncbi:hypothetical protein ACLB2K_008239 [Fragaria x ananassa]